MGGKSVMDLLGEGRWFDEADYLQLCLGCWGLKGRVERSVVVVAGGALFVLRAVHSGSGRGARSL